MAALPVAKLGALILKAISKPISRRLGTYATTSPGFRTVCVTTGKANRQVLHQFNRIVRDGNAKLKPIDEELVVKRGADLLADIFVLSVGGGVIVYEYERNRGNKNAEMERIHSMLNDHEERLKKLSV